MRMVLMDLLLAEGSSPGLRSARWSQELLHAGMNQVSEKQLNDAEKQFKTFESMINSMTPQERTNPDLLAKVSPCALTSLAATLLCSRVSQRCQAVLASAWWPGPNCRATLSQRSAQMWRSRDAEPTTKCLYKPCSRLLSLCTPPAATV